MSTFLKFRLEVPADSVTVNNTSSTLFWDIAQPGSSPTSVPSDSQKIYGNFLSDSVSGRYNMSWNSWEEFLSFLAREQVANSIELRQISSKTGAVFSLCSFLSHLTRLLLQIAIEQEPICITSNLCYLTVPTVFLLCSSSKTLNPNIYLPPYK
jgi:hypothetical protein